jgi:uncharacterized protein (TIGR02678 family)
VNLEALDRQRAFTGLLANPVVDRRRHPELFALVRHPRHRSTLIQWFASRLGYRLVVTESAARLFRLPLDGSVAAPHRIGAPPRRALVLAILAAAAAEDADDITTTQDLSDRVRALTAHEEVQLAPYDPDRFAERQLFVRAVDILVSTGALRPLAAREAEERREGWAHRRDSVGGAYEVERELLLRLVDPSALAAALGEGGSSGTGPDRELAVRFAVLRRLVELPICLLSDLTEQERAYAIGQRRRIVDWCAEMTGWVVEQRAEGLALIADHEDATDLPFPRLRAVDFISLLMIDELLAVADTSGRLTEVDLDRAAADVRARHPRAMTKELNTDEAVRERAVELLRALDVIRPLGPDGWWLSPAAARFRSPSVVSVTARIEEDEP